MITKFPGKVYFVFPNFDEKDRSGRRFFTAIMVSDCPGEKILKYLIIVIVIILTV